MAFSSSKISDQLSGAKRIQVWSVDFDSATSGTFETGLAFVEHVQLNNETTEADGKAERNTTNGSDTSNGSVFVSGVTADDVGTLLVYGR